MEEFKLFDAEYKFMNIIWEEEPINSTHLVKLCLTTLGWKKSTTYTVLKKLCERGYLKNQDATVTSLVKKEEIQRYESNAVVEKAFGGSLPKFLTAFLNERRLSQEELKELKQIIEKGMGELSPEREEEL